MKKNFLIFIAFALISILAGCSKDDNADNTFNIFSVQDDITFGQQMRDEIHNNPADYPLLSESQYPQAYYHIYRIRDSLLMSGDLKYADKFDWKVDIIRNDSVLNAFCAPGGYICVYTGINKFLDNEAEFAGVMGHEMAHADRRHSTDQLTKAYGIQLLLGIVLGNNQNQLAQIAADLAAGVAMLAFSRAAENESDEYSVKYLYNTAYEPTGVKGFFEKIGGSPQPPEFLSTHPNPDNRYDHILEIWESLGGKTGDLFVNSYNQFKSSLP
jgi:predicted Zn-dependent protease